MIEDVGANSVLQVEESCQSGQYFVYKKEGRTTAFKPVSMHHNKLDALKQIATLLNLNVHIEEAYSK